MSFSPLLTKEQVEKHISRKISDRNELIGTKYGNLTVLDEQPMYKRYGTASRLIMLIKCRCDCGSISYFSKSGVKHGVTKSCGCNSNSGKDLTGKRFGKLIVLKISHTNSRRKFWECKCDCGGSKVCTTKSLTSGYVKSCGCAIRNKNHIRWKGYEDIPYDFFSSYKRGALTRGLDFEITIEYVWEIFKSQNFKCALSGIDLCFSETRKQRGLRTVSIDRKDNKKGYVLGNIQLVHKVINIMKNKLNDEEFIKYCNLISEHNKNRYVD